MTEENVSGGYYSQNYLRASTPSLDSDRMRFRVAAFLDEYFDEVQELNAGNYIQRELGLPIVQNGRYVSWDRYLKTCNINDFLDIVTAIARFSPRKTVYNGNSNTSRKMDFVVFVGRVFRETNVAYRLDSIGGVHPFVDAAFTAELSELIQGFSNSELNAAREHILEAEKALLLSDPDPRKAVRASFDAVENIFRLLFPKCNRLTKHFVDGHLLPEVRSNYAIDDYESDPMMQMIESFNFWIAAGHRYRHEPGKIDVTAPSMDFAIQFVSHSLAYARWLARLYGAKIHPNPA